MQKKVELGVLDFNMRLWPTVREPQPPAAYLDDALRLARAAESWGYGRYWLAQHYGGQDCWASPEVPLTFLAAQTKTIRLGTAGILLNLHAPYRIANDYALLAHLFPDRIDLGLARGIPWIAANETELRRSAGDEATFESRFVRVKRLLTYTPANVGTGEVYVLPSPPRCPALWLLGTSGRAAAYAADEAVNFCLSLFHKPVEPEELRAFFSRRGGQAIVGSIAVAGICADTNDAAQAIAARSVRSVIPTVIGDPATVRDAVHDIVRRSGAEEVVFLDLCTNPEEKRRSVRLFSRAVAEA